MAEEEVARQAAAEKRETVEPAGARMGAPPRAGRAG